MGTMLAGVTGLLVWLDNQHGFRDAEAIATLLSAVFSMVATAWLVATVLLQRAELQLQRQELVLQREESRRIADETGQQARLMNEQLAISVRQNITDEVRAYLQSEFKTFLQIKNSLRDYTVAALSDKVGTILTRKDVSSTFGHTRVLVKEKSSNKVNSIEYTNLIDVVDNKYPLERLKARYDSADLIGLGEWFRLELPYIIGNIILNAEKLSALDLRLIFGVASRMRPDE